MPKVCFVICPIGPFGSDIRKDADDFMKYIVAPCADELGYGKPIRADELPEPGRITSQIIELLNTADLVIADLSLGNPNVYYELSCRPAIGKAVIHMAVDGTKLSFDVADNRTIFYSMHASRVEQARKDLTDQINRVRETGYKPRNPIVDAVGLISLEKSAEPTQQAIAALAREVASLRGDVGDIKSSLREPLLGTPMQHFLNFDQHGASRVTGHPDGPGGGGTFVLHPVGSSGGSGLVTNLAGTKDDTDRDEGSH